MLLKNTITDNMKYLHIFSNTPPQAKAHQALSLLQINSLTTSGQWCDAKRSRS